VVKSVRLVVGRPGFDSLAESDHNGITSTFEWLDWL